MTKDSQNRLTPLEDDLSPMVAEGGQGERIEQVEW